MAKRYTVLIIPDNTHKVKRFRLAPWLAPLLLAIMLGSAGMAYYWFDKYQALQGELPERIALDRQSKIQKAQIKAFGQKLDSFKIEMSSLRKFNRRLRILANLEKPGDQDHGLFGVGGTEKTEYGPGVRLSHSASDRQLMTMRRDLDQLKAIGETEREIQRELAKFLKERRSILACTPSVWPVRGWVTSGFGYRISSFTGKRQFHPALDISTRKGTPIVAPADGVVTFVGRQGGFGNLLVINHGHGMVTRYGHLSKFKVKKGQKVKRGQTVALVGNTGRSSGPHLHYEVLLSGVPTNPRYYILD